MQRSARTSWPAIALASALVLLAGCGNSRTPVPSLTTPVAPTGLRELRFRADGLSLQAPANWAFSTGHGSLVAVVSSGEAVVALWRYPSHVPLPSGAAALRETARKLVSEVRTRDPRFRLLATRITTIGGAPAIELDALEQVAGHSRQVSSSHLFAPGAEVVLDEYAPPALFAGVDRSVFSPIRQSLLITRGLAHR